MALPSAFTSLALTFTDESSQGMLASAEASCGEAQKPITSMNPQDFSDWSFDGSSTGQAEGNNSDCILRRVQQP